MKFFHYPERRRVFTLSVVLFRVMLIGFAGLLARAQTLTTELPVPNIGDLTRVDRNTLPSPQDTNTATYILKTSSHATMGDAYVVVTDQTDAAFLDPLERLAQFHHGSIVHVNDLGALRTSATERDQLISDLRRAQPRFVAIAPKLSSFTENMLLGMWNVLAMLSDDQQLPVFPGILVAPNQTAFNSLIDRSINYSPQTVGQIRPFVMGQVLGPKPFGLRSLQKIRMMRNLFTDHGCATHSLVILAYTAVERGVNIAPATDQWQVAMSRPDQSIEMIPPDARPALDDASLLLMFGHGNPDTVCNLNVSDFRDVRMTNKTVMCGDCFSASIQGNDESFAMRAVENGADVVYAHMRENAGFPHLFPVLEAWMNGLTVGEAYQRQINALLAFNGFSADDLISRNVADANALLYVIIGDPALQPLAKMTPATL
ncbi:MAG: C25 family cysteine peptidase [Methylacidiphilales bacterium]|nr:C25 family cysteine peptidase [Candidatus Methylacidiphilales bacterium]